MTAPPCPSVEEQAEDPNLCPICGHWCGKSCERRFAPLPIHRIRAYVRAWQTLRYAEAGEKYTAPLDVEAFAAWFSRLTDSQSRELPRGILDGAWSAIFEAIAEAISRPADTDPICQTIRELVTAERALAAGDLSHSNEGLAELARAIRERGRK